ncbi:MAG: hypothetical protein IJU62_10300 [Muribaculaceae bacterium]|nr:hypothetical protein [Muribaculaceae bacterium]
MPPKSIDRSFLHYGVQTEDMQIIEQECLAEEIDSEWFKEEILRPYNEQRNDSNVVDEKKLMKIMKKAIKSIK